MTHLTTDYSNEMADRTHQAWNMFTAMTLVMTAALVFASPRSWADFETDIAAEGGEWASFYEQEDLEGLMTLYVDDAIVALHGQPALFGIDAIREYFSTRILSLIHI